MIAQKNNMNPLPMGFLTLGIYFTFSFSLFHLTQPLCHNNERSALLQFKESLKIEYCYNALNAYLYRESWNLEENSECCLWHGIKCNETTGYVIELDLSCSCLQGSVNSSSTLFNLVHLQRLSLAQNNFCHSKIPSAVKNLSNLSYLDLSSSNFSGQIPLEMLELSRLEYLDLSGNSLQLQQRGLKSLVDKLTNLKRLNLNSINISSSIPNSLGNLSSLTDLSLSDCQLQGVIPSSLGNLTRLGSLDLSSNQLSGRIPSQIGKLTRLGSLDLSSNQLQGQIPSSISKLKNLGYLLLHLNQLQGPIPSSIFELKNLYFLDLHSNHLNGTVELDVSKLSKSVEHLSLSSNNLSVLIKTTGTISQQLYSLGLRSCNLTEFPNFLQNQDLLDRLDLSSNKISGQIPKWFFNVSVYNLLSLNLSNNLLTGGFDQRHVVLPWIFLLALDLRSNRLQGSLPLPMPSIFYYLVSNNNLIGNIPSSICTLSRLEVLDLSYNNLSGVLPRCLGNFSDQLSVLGLQSNNIHGSIPQSFMIESSLRMIDLSQNKLQGKIPRSLANCKSLEFLNLGYNQINDLFPSWLGILPELKVLILKSNRFHGVLKEPETNFEFSKLHVIDLSHNMFMGELPWKYFQCLNAMKNVNDSLQLTYMEERLVPRQIGKYAAVYLYEFSLSYAYSLIMSNQGTERKYWKIPTILTSIILSGNQFTGQIPTSISNLRGLNFLNLSHNHLLGHIPSSLGNLSLLSLDLSSNRLSGEIPPQLVDLTFLGFFNVSQNQLEGRIPQGKQFDTFESSSFEGNPGLCGKPLSKGCGSSNALEKREDEGSESSTFAFDWKIVLTGFVSGLIVGVILGNEYFTKIVEWFATNNLWLQLKTAIKRKTRGHRN